MLKRSFTPVVNDAVRVLILGSLPGDASLAQGQYYAHRQNQFWRLMSEVINIDLPSLNYTSRLEALLANRIGLWDVIAEASREGSLDSRIRDQANNDLIGLVTRLPHLNTIAFNGGTAARLGLKVLHDNLNRYQVISLPSSSPAYTLQYSEKLKVWITLKERIQG